MDIAQIFGTSSHYRCGWAHEPRRGVAAFPLLVVVLSGRPSMSIRILCGFHAVQTALDHAPEKIHRLWLEAGRQDRRAALLVDAARAAQIPIETVDKKKLEQLAGSANHQGLAAEVVLPAERGEAELHAAFDAEPTPPLWLVLDHVQDPHNLGACLRTCDAAGVAGVVVTKDQSAHLTPTVCKIASGAAETVPVYQVTNLVRTLLWFKAHGLWVVGAAGEAQHAHFDADLARPMALVVGAEGSGLRRLTRETCDYLVKIPMHGTVDSLNLSVATGILLYEALRQRRG